MFHAVGTGTDTRLTPQLLLYTACFAAVLAAVWWRLARTGGAARGIRGQALGGAALIPMALAWSLVPGPLQPYWSQRAGGAPVQPRPASTGPAPVASADYHTPSPPAVRRPPLPAPATSTDGPEEGTQEGARA
jgi:hypothetical protein